MNQNATRGAIASALRTGQTDSAIARQLRADRHRVTAIRRSNGLPRIPRQPLTLEEKWASLTREAPGGHLEWLGEHAKLAGTPVMRYREESYSPAAVAFRQRTGRAPEGYVFAECGMQHCVAPGHVDDEPGRVRAREQLRFISGGQERPSRCVHGHDQQVHGRYETDGRAYCGECKRLQKQKTAVAS